MINRQEVYDKYGGRCAYSGTPLEDDWQVDHIIPQRLKHWIDSDVMRKMLGNPVSDIDHIDNLLPSQRIINHYKRSLDLKDFRKIWLGGLHKRLERPKNPRTEQSKKTKEYRLKVASYFGITPDKPFDGWFYFEKVELGEWFR